MIGSAGTSINTGRMGKRKAMVLEGSGDGDSTVDEGVKPAKKQKVQPFSIEWWV